MKKTIICLALSASLMLSGAVTVFATDGAGTSVTVVPTMEFTGTVVKLSLDEAIKLMQEQGLKAQTAQIRKKSDEATARGYKETATSIKDDLNAEGGSSGTYTYIDQDAAKLKRDFAKENLDNNYQASLNEIASDAVSLYYNVLLCQDVLKASEDNLKIQKELLAREEKRFSLGLASKINLTTAQNAVKTATDSVSQAKMNLNSVKMGFNISMNYPVMQAVTFTDTLKELPAPTGTLETAVKSGLEKRMEIKKAVLLEQIQAAKMDHLGLIMSKSSASYLQQQVMYSQLQMATKSTPKTIEQEIRQKYMDVQAKKSALESARSTKALADEGYRLALITYETGMNTITDVQEAQLKAFQANQGVSGAVKEYDLAIYAYQYCQTVGTSPIDL